MRNQTAVLVLVDIAPDSFLWGLSRYVIGRFSLYNIPGLQFFKVLGSGFEGGFSTKPSLHKQGLFCVFDSEHHAKQFRAHSKLVQAYMNHSREFFAVSLNAFSTRGSWANTQLDITAKAPVSGPIASLTRASIKPLKANAFWKKAQPAEVSINQSEGVILSAGLGEAPLDPAEMGKAGADTMLIGVETGSDRVRENMRKGFNSQDLKFTIEQFSKNKISL